MIDPASLPMSLKVHVMRMKHAECMSISAFICPGGDDCQACSLGCMPDNLQLTPPPPLDRITAARDERLRQLQEGQ